jgi:hypothetical protein
VTELEPLVEDFAKEIADLLEATLKYGDDIGDDERTLEVKPRDVAGRLMIRSGSKEKLGGIPLYAAGKRVAKLEIEFRCDFDTSENYLAVRKSKIQVSSLKREEPLFRIDYVHECDYGPSAHWNIHAERGSLSAWLAQANPEHSSKLSKVHFPVGGSRYRPCLEDVLDLLIEEFHIDHLDTAPDAIAAGRERWRRKQVKVLVRDSPDDAVHALEKLGYTVQPPDTGPSPTKLERLRER